jgi:DNA-binding transcriptional regulator YiaG
MQICMQKCLTPPKVRSIIEVKGTAMTTKVAKRPKKASNPPRTPRIKVLRQTMHLPRKTFSRLLGFSERALADWESGKQPPNDQAERRLNELQRLQEGLRKVVKPEVIPHWIDTPNEAFGGLKPLEVIERGETDRLWRMIYFLESGIAS